MTAADEDEAMTQLRRATAGGVRAGDFSLSAERVQTVLRHTQEVLKNYERVHGTKNFLNDTFQACDMKCAEFELVRFSSEVLGVETGCSVDDGTTPEKTSEEIKEIVARKNWLRLQDWEDNDAVLAAKTAPIGTMQCDFFFVWNVFVRCLHVSIAPRDYVKRTKSAFCSYLFLF